MMPPAPERQWERLQPTLLRWAVALCFFCHGVWAIRSATIYHSEWSVWIQRLFPSNPYTAARHFLTTAGAIDVIAALAMLLRRPPRLVYAWVIPWGAATAAARAVVLGSFDDDIWQGIVAPLAEVLARVVNFGVPLLAWQVARVSAGEGGRLVEERRLYAAMIAASVVAIALRYLTAYLGPEYPFKLDKLGQSLWSFHGAGLTAWLAILALVVAAFSRRKVLAPVVTVLVVAGLAWNEGLDLVYRHWPRGVGVVLVNIGEHATLYMALAGWLVSRRAPGLPSSPESEQSASLRLVA